MLQRLRLVNENQSFVCPFCLSMLRDCPMKRFERSRCSKGTVASRLNRGHKELARRLAHLRDQVVLGE